MVGYDVLFLSRNSKSPIRRRGVPVSDQLGHDHDTLGHDQKKTMAQRSKPNSNSKRSIPHGNAVAGLAAGFVSSLVMHPLDVVTTRMQAQDSRTATERKYKNPIEALIKIARKDGVLQLYPGVVPNVVGSMTNWGVYFLGYNYSRNQLRAYINRDRDVLLEPEPRELSPVMNLFCATAIGCVSAIITQPIWLAKTRMELQSVENPMYKSMRHCLVTVAKNEGVEALFKYKIPVIPPTLE